MQELFLSLKKNWLYHFDDDVISRSKYYAGSGRISEFTGSINDAKITLCGSVQGSSRRPYKTSVEFTQNKREGRLQVKCSCPYADRFDGACKHAAAIVQYGLAMHKDGRLLSTGENSFHIDEVAAEPDLPIVKDRKALSFACARWLEQVRQSSTSAAAPERKFAAQEELIWEFALGSKQTGGPCRLFASPWYCSIDPSGRIGACNNPRFCGQEVSPAFISTTHEERIYSELFAVLRRNSYTFSGENPVIAVPPAICEHLLEAAAASGRSFIARSSRESSAPLSRNENYAVERGWAQIKNAAQKIEPVCLVGGKAVPHVVFSDRNAWYINVENSTIGLLQHAEGVEALRTWLSGPSMARESFALIAGHFSAFEPSARSIAAPHDAREEVRAQLRPVLLLQSVEVSSLPLVSERAVNPLPCANKISFGRLTFMYGDIEICPHRHGLRNRAYVQKDGKNYEIVRDRRQEQSYLEDLYRSQLVPVSERVSWLSDKFFTFDVCASYLTHEAQLETWSRFLGARAKNLRRAGWEITLDASFYHTPRELPAPLEFSLFDAEGSGNENWFDLDLGIEVHNKRIDLAPLLLALLDEKSFLRYAKTIPLDIDGTLYNIPTERFTPLLDSVIELHNPRRNGETGLRLSRMSAMTLADLPIANARWHQPETLAVLRRKFSEFQGVSEANLELPASFHGTLRPYQRIGVAWLQFLAAYHFDGILADDMGLGKTVQTLAHLAVERARGRVENPVLIVAPTSVISNWRREIEKFLPDLRIAVYHGKERHTLADNLPAFDVVLSTYAILRFDEKILSGQRWSYLIFDESQQLKNAATKTATCARALQADRRLCLSGTPIENNLSELWSQFHLLMPGFLSAYPVFKRIFQNPIERDHDNGRRRALQHRVRPFVLRRKKEDVEQELPPKTVMTQVVGFEQKQRDLYESIRSVMDKRVREEIQRKGLARSHIVILDALLKLRQCCCDPRLVPTAAAKRVQESAKLEFLMEFLPSLIAEGRRILLFSQFTSMLDLIEQELQEKAKDVAYVRLDGQSKNREQLVQKFQEGDLPLFLLSLKAGGVGLNLTAADVVILYDPWWNPAVEAQAFDRAHRIGQTKSVFVYKLVVEGSIEEKILKLQERKKDLAAGVLVDGDEHLAKFSSEEILDLFAPLAKTEEMEVKSRNAAL